MIVSKFLRSAALGWTLAIGATGGLLATVSLPHGMAYAEEAGQRLPDAAMKSSEAPGKLQTATLAGGCFWGIQGVFQHVKGVKQAVSGYAGGSRETANYKTVGRGRSGHAESVKITYDPSQVRYDQLLQIFFSVALDPTEVNRQGPDSGTQYRSAIFPADADQAKVAKAYIAQLDATKAFSRPIATKIEPGATFYAAEDYHQDYMALNPDAGYIVVNDAPKLRAFQQLFPERNSAEPALVNKPKA